MLACSPSYRSRFALVPPTPIVFGIRCSDLCPCARSGVKKQACIERKCVELSTNRPKSSMNNMHSVRRDVQGGFDGLMPYSKRKQTEPGHLRVGASLSGPFSTPLANFTATNAIQPALLRQGAPHWLDRSFHSEPETSVKAACIRSNDPVYARVQPHRPPTPGLAAIPAHSRSSAVPNIAGLHAAEPIVEEPNVAEYFPFVGVGVQPCMPLRARRKRCGKCKQCLDTDCGTCTHCADKARFGGKGVKKQACLKRRCIYENALHEESPLFSLVQHPQAHLSMQQPQEVLQLSRFTSELAAMKSVMTATSTGFAPLQPPTRPSPMQAMLLQSRSAPIDKYGSPILGERIIMDRAELSSVLKQRFRLGSGTEAFKLATCSPVSVIEMCHESLPSIDRLVHDVDMPAPGLQCLDAEVPDGGNYPALVSSIMDRGNDFLPTPSGCLSPGASNADFDVDEHNLDPGTPDCYKVDSILSSKDATKMRSSANGSSPTMSGSISSTDVSHFSHCIGFPNSTMVGSISSTDVSQFSRRIGFPNSTNTTQMLTAAPSTASLSALLDESELFINGCLHDDVAALAPEDWTRLFDE